MPTTQYLALGKVATYISAAIVGIHGIVRFFVGPSRGLVGDIVWSLGLFLVLIVLIIALLVILVRVTESKID
jgi:hypothetical protein